MSLPRAFVPIALALVLGVAFARPLVVPSVEHHGEAREGLVVQGIVDRGEWILPRRNGELPSKPPLFHWLAAGVAEVVGLSDGVVRLPSAVAAWVVAVATFAVGCALGGERVAWLAVAALLGMAPFLEAATQARVDMVFTACTTTALGAFFLWYRQRGRRARAVLYAATAAAVLAKGPIGAALPALVIIAFLLVDGELALLRTLWSPTLAALAVVIVGGWYALAAAVGGREFLELQLVRENFHRFVGDAEFRRVDHGHTSRLAVLLATQFLPWTIAIAVSCYRRLRGAAFDAGDRFLHAWWVVVLAVFTIAAGKRPVYLLPAAPAIALLAGRQLAELTAGLAPLRTRFGLRTATAQLLAVLALFDLGTLAILQVRRETHVRRPTLGAFADTVSHTVPGRSPLPAVASIPASDRMVLAYRLRRPVPRRTDVGTEPYWLAPHGKDFALMRAAGPEEHAEDGRAVGATLQESAR
jgi:4-amino-4-deoxy-L-arabinose transferase-like glycosyltransferase